MLFFCLLFEMIIVVSRQLFSTWSLFCHHCFWSISLFDQLLNERVRIKSNVIEVSIRKHLVWWQRRFVNNCFYITTAWRRRSNLSGRGKRMQNIHCRVASCCSNSRVHLNIKTNPYKHLISSFQLCHLPHLLTYCHRDWSSSCIFTTRKQMMLFLLRIQVNCYVFLSLQQSILTQKYDVGECTLG